MTLYVPIQRLNGRNDHYRLSCIFHQLGIDAEYNQGGWDDRTIGRVLPHLKFEDDEDATAFALYIGSRVNRNIPVETKE